MAETGATSYDGFLSYSHAADDLLAPRLQSGLQRFAKPWWKRRALHIFRDEASLSANPHLWSSITDALDDSEWFVLLLSPEAAQSEWVNREIDYWKEHKDPQRILPVVTDGEFGWEAGDVSGDAVPDSLRGVFADEPRWVDLRFARTETQLDLRHTRFRDAIADIAAAIRGIAKDELESEEIHQHRRTVRTAWTGGIAILALGVAATVGAIVAYNSQQDAQAERDRAVAAEQDATQERDRAVAAEQSAGDERDRAIAAEEEAEHQQTIAEEQAVIAQANAELARSRELAASAINVLDDDPELSVLLALDAARGADPTFESLVALRSALQQHRTVRTITWPEEWDWGGALAGSMSPDGKYVAVSGIRNRLAVWDLADGSDEPVWSFEASDPDHAVIVPYFNTDGSHVIATVAWFNQAEMPAEWPAPSHEVGVYVWEATSGELIQHLRGPACPINGLFQSGRFLDETRPVAALAPAGDDCAVGYGTEADLWLINLMSGEMTAGSTERVPGWTYFPIASLTEDNRYVSWSDGYLASGVMDLQTGVNTLTTDDGNFAILTSDGSRLLTGGAARLTLWDMDSGEELWTTETPANLSDTWFTDDGALIYMGGHDGVVDIRDAETGESLRRLTGHRGFAWPVSMTLDGTRIASFSGDRTIRIWDLTRAPKGEITGFDIPGFPIYQSGLLVGDQVATLLYPDQASVFTEPGTATIFDPETGQVAATFEGYGGQMVRLSPDGRLLAGQPFAAPGILGPVQIRDVESGEVLVELEDWCSFDQVQYQPGEDCTDNAAALGDVAWWMEFSPDGTMLAISGDLSGRLGVWNTTTGQRLTWLSEHPSNQGDLVVLRFNPTSELLVAANPEISVYETDGWSKTASLPMGGFPEWVDLIFTSDGKHLLGGHRYQGIVTIDTTTWEYTGDPLPGHQGNTRDMAISPDGSLIAVASSDGFARIWDARTGELLQAIPSNAVAVTQVDFVDDSHLLVIPAAIDEHGFVVTTDIPELLDIARSRITRGFTADECATYHLDPCPDLATIRGG